jgi:hypothetical protein
MASVLPRKVRRERSDINRLQRLDYVCSAAFVADPGTFASHVQIDYQPAIERSCLKNTMAGRKVHLPVAQIVDILKETAI